MRKTNMRGTRSRTRLYLPLSLLLLTPAYYLFPWEHLAGRFAWAGFAFFLAYTVILPGLALVRLLSSRRSDPLDRAAAAMLFGLSYFLVIAFVWTLSKVSLGVFSNVYPVAIVVLAIALFVQQAKAAVTFEVAGGRDVLRPAIFAVALLVLFILLLRVGVSVYFMSDTLDHVAYVSQIVEDETPFPHDAFYLDAGANGADIRKGLLHAYYGYMAFYLHAAPLRVLGVMTAVLAITLILCVYSMTLWFFGNRAIAILAAVLFALSQDGGLAGTMLTESYYSHRFGLAFYWFFLVFSLRFLRDRGARNLWLAALFAFSACAVHVFFGLLLAFAGATMFLWKVCFPQYTMREHFSGVLRLGVVVGAAVLPYALFRYVTAYPTGVNELHDMVQGVVLLGNSLYFAQPLRLIRWFGPVGIITFAAIIPLWRERERNNALGFLIASLVTIPLVLFNPILLPPLHRAMTYLVFRVNNLCPFFVLTAYFLFRFFNDKSFRAHKRAYSTIVVACLCAAVVGVVLPIGERGSLSPAFRKLERQYSYLRWQGPLERLDTTLPPASVIASDPLTSYSVTAFTPYYVVCTLDQHAPPNDALLEKRVSDARDILSPYVSMKRTTELLADNRATHVILNNRQPERFLVEYWLMDREIYGESYRKFAEHPELFARTPLTEDFVVFAWNGRQAVTDTVPSSAFKVRALPDDFAPVGRPAGDALLQGIRVDSTRVARGDTVGVRLVWSGTGTYALRNYMVSIRFDHANPDLPFDGRPFPKIARKIKEGFTGRRYRFREQHKIRNGFLSPDTWSAGELIVDKTKVAVPEDLIPGPYVISVKLFVEIHQPNYRIRDFLYDDDMYQGIPVANIVID
jgi:hypothetical protein